MSNRLILAVQIIIGSVSYFTGNLTTDQFYMFVTFFAVLAVFFEVGDFHKTYKDELERQRRAKERAESQF